MLAQAILVCILLPLAAFAEELPQPRTDAVSDFAAILPPAEEARIADLIREIRDESGVHVVVVTMDRISKCGGWGQSFEAYATGLFNAWGIGDARRDDGIMLLVVTGTRGTRIELGSGYARAYDRRAQEVIDTAILPLFLRGGRTAAGILDGIRGVRDQIVQPFVKGEWVGLWHTVLIGLGGSAGQSV